MIAQVRLKIPEKQRQELLYESNFVCVVCKDRASHIHHIDHDNRNNVSENLVTLCQTHHDDAHTKRELSQNLTPAHLKNFKIQWIAQVAEERKRKASLAGQQQTADAFTKIGLTWGYINHGRVAQHIDDDMLGYVNTPLFDRCKRRHIVDERGIVLQPAGWQSSGGAVRNTIYDWFPYGDDQALHLLYNDFVDQISRRVRPLHLIEQNWKKIFVREMLQHGGYIFFIKDIYFKPMRSDDDNVHVKCAAKKGGINIEFYVDTRDMFGTTSITVSFHGHKQCAALLQIKSIETSKTLKTIHCTPIALGVCFRG